MMFHSRELEGELEGPHGGRFHVNDGHGHPEGYTTLWGTTLACPHPLEIPREGEGYREHLRSEKDNW